MARKPDTPCAGECGRLLWRGTGSRAPGEMVCRDCRRAVPKAPRVERRTGATVACESCGVQFRPWRSSRNRFCSLACKGVASRGDTNDGHKARLYAAPGLGHRRRKRLLDTWIDQGRSCAYCPAPASTLDHVVPLSRGGTNHEGNLAPCCRRCNASKGGRLLIEWRAVGAQTWLRTA